MKGIPMTSSRQDWETPAKIFEPLRDEFNITLDVCATSSNAKCPYFYTPSDDALQLGWNLTKRNCWMNPPYGRGIDKWIEKAYRESLLGITVVCLVPARTDTRWWHDYCIKGTIRFIRGRIKFVGAKENAPFPSAVVIFGAKV